jgi:hypothetical protein
MYDEIDAILERMKRQASKYDHLKGHWGNLGKLPFGNKKKLPLFFDEVELKTERRGSLNTIQNKSCGSQKLADADT